MIWEIDEQQRTIEGLGADGRPDPAYAAALGLVRAPFGRRSLAFVVDWGAWLLLQVPFWVGAVPLLVLTATGAISPYGLVHHPNFVLAVVCASVTVALSLAFLIVQMVLHGRRGVTLGKRAAGIRTVEVRTLERPGVGRVVVRFLLLWASTLVPLFGPTLLLLSPTFDPQRRGRGWHDKAARVWLVDVRAGLQPYDQKRMRVARKTVAAEPVSERAVLPSLATVVGEPDRPRYLPGDRVSAGVLGAPRPAPSPSAPTPPSAPPAASAPSPAPAPSPAADAGPAPTTEAPAPPQPRTSATRWALRLDSGETIPVGEPVLLGRSPDAAGHPGARAIALPDESRSLSKTHLLVRPTTAGLEVTDCHSTNGSAVVHAGVEQPAPAGTALTAAGGDLIRLGDRVATVVEL